MNHFMLRSEEITHLSNRLSQIRKSQFVVSLNVLTSLHNQLGSVTLVLID